MQSINWPSTENYFSFYGLNPVFEIDTAELRKLFLEKSRQFHPDFFEGNRELQGKAIDITAYNNKAYKALNQAAERLKYLIQMHLSGSDDNQKLPQDFLMEMLDLNEQIDEFTFGNNQDELKRKITADINLQIQNLMDKLIALVKIESWADAKSELLKLNYLERLAVRLIEPQ